jgi:RND family efflux transporter MFP subunit
MDAELQRKLNALKIDREDRRGPGGRGRWLIGLSVVVIAGAIGVWVWLQPRAELVRTALAEEVASTGGGGASVLNASGYVTARRQSTVSSKITGKVTEVLVEEGMTVEAGQVLARLDDSQARLGVGMAQASLEAARKGIIQTEARLREAKLRQDRLKRLVAEGVSPAADRDAIEGEVDTLLAQIEVQREQVKLAEQELGLARQNLDDTVIRAPFSGVAITKNAQPGEIISPMSAGGGFTRTGISTVVDMSSLEIEVDVNEAYIQRVQAGQQVQATLDAYPEWPIPARVITTIPAADRQKATVTVRIAFERLDPRILPDMGVKVAFLADPVAADAAPRRVVHVPRAAIRGAKGEEFVLVVGGDERLERRAVKPGLGASDPAEIAAGLRGGERVVIEGSPELTSGVVVRERGR